MSTTYLYFQRGSVIYWHDDDAVVEAAWNIASVCGIRRGFQDPSPIQSTEIHPTRLGAAWRLTGAYDCA